MVDGGLGPQQEGWGLKDLTWLTGRPPRSQASLCPCLKQALGNQETSY